MVKLADTPDLGSGAARCEGSSPFLGNIINLITPLFLMSKSRDTKKEDKKKPQKTAKEKKLAKLEKKKNKA
jgi:hypothetical protein